MIRCGPVQQHWTAAAGRWLWDWSGREGENRWPESLLVASGFSRAHQVSSGTFNCGAQMATGWRFCHGACIFWHYTEVEGWHCGCEARHLGWNDVYVYDGQNQEFILGISESLFGFCVADPSLVPHKVSVLKHLVELFFFCSLASYALLTGVAIQSNQKIFIHQIQALIYFTSGCRTL